MAEAVELIKKGKWSSSSRNNRLIAKVNKIPITVKHVSGNFKLNLVADNQSHFPSDCGATNCSVCNFVSDAVNSVLDLAARCSAACPQNDGLTSSLSLDTFSISCTNRQSWTAVQNTSDCYKSVVKYLQTGKVPTTKVASIAKDGLLVIKEEINLLPPGAVKERIVVPTSVAGGLLFHLHNYEFQCHLARNQLKASFQRRFHTFHLDAQ